ncbi:MAG: aminoacyl-tRNA hydrolase [Desulfitobacteriaceae bacterium]
MKVIAGLGNPGVEYAETRHNAGFVLVDNLAEEGQLDFRSKFQGLLVEGQWNGERVFLFKPQTYMNLSGRALRDLVAFYKILAEDILVVHDDMDLPLGKIRLRNRGSAGGHNGIRSIITELGTEEFWRLKLGIGRPPADWAAPDYVLGRFRPEEILSFEEALTKAEKAVQLWLTGQSSKAMNVYNR